MRYLELDLLWGDKGPVASLRLENTGPSTLIEPVRLFAQYAGTRREIGASPVRVPAGESVTALIDLDRDFPSTASWLQRGSEQTPIRVWAGPALDDPRIAAESDL